MRCTVRNCKNKAEVYSPYDKKRVFCHIHAVKYMSEKNLNFLPRIEEKK